MSDQRALPAIIGGSGLQQMPNLKITERMVVDTPWGEPSSRVSVGNLSGQKVLFLARHGDDHDIPPHKVNYRANVSALAQLGASHIFAFNAVGGIHEDMGAGSIVVPNQIVDYTWGREHTYSDSANVALQHVEFTEPYDAVLRKLLIDAAEENHSDIVRHGVYAATQGPRLESAAEINRLERDGCDLVGMTGMPEAGLAREKSLPYACLALVVNAAAGKSQPLISFAEIEKVISTHMPAVQTILATACGKEFAIHPQLNR